MEEIATLASPETILRWYRHLVAAKYDGNGRSSTGARGKRDDATTQLVRMARENPNWGYTRLRGALKNVGVDLSRSTIARALKEQGIEPAPRRGRSMSWTFLAAHWEAIAAADFVAIEVVTSRGLVRYFVLFVMRLKTRRVHIAGISPRLDDAWMAPVARNLTDAGDGFLKNVRHLIVDRDPLYTQHFNTILASANVRLLRLPPSSPNLNAYAERFVRSVKEECLARVVPLGERHLQRLLSEYITHFHSERNHQGLANVIPSPSPPHRPRSAARQSIVVTGSEDCCATTTATPHDHERSCRGTIRRRHMQGRLERHERCVGSRRRRTRTWRRCSRSGPALRVVGHRGSRASS